MAQINISEISNRMFTITAEGVNKLNAIYLIISYFGNHLRNKHSIDFKIKLI